MILEGYSNTIFFQMTQLYYCLEQIYKMKITESESAYKNLEAMSAKGILQGINQEDKTVAFQVEKALPQIHHFVLKTLKRMLKGGRLFYLGAGTSGRLGIVDASECPPTFGVDYNTVIGLIAGGPPAIQKAVEFAEDNLRQAWKDLKKYKPCKYDIILGIAASGTTKYVLGGIEKARQKGLLTGALTCNPHSPLAKKAKISIEVVVGSEFITGSTRMKAGTAQKLVLNMISTTLMIKLGHIKGNKMIDMQLSNKKLIFRGVKMLQNLLNIEDSEEAKSLLLKMGSVRKAIENYKNKEKK